MFDAVLNNIKDYLEVLREDKKKVLKILLIILILLVALGLRIHKNNESEITVNTSEIEEVSEGNMYVDISGAVNNPGVYEVDSDTRLYEVIEKAGGLADNANIDGINRAEFIEDGQKITIPFMSEETETQTDSSVTTSGVTESGLININVASKEELMGITGVGEVIAERIIEYREENKFKTIEDIMSVKGIGNATYEKMKEQITV